MIFKAIHQFTPSVAFGDGVSNGMLFTQKLLIGLGFQSKIFICMNRVDIKFQNELYHISQYEQSENNLLLYHHSIGHEWHERIMKFLDKKILVYHNITPPHFLGKDKKIQFLCELGRKQLKNSSSYFIGSYGVSEYNCKELFYYNYPSPKVLTLLLDLEKQTFTKPSVKIMEKYKNSYNILFVGRVVPHKSQHQLIDVLFQLKDKSSSRNEKLFIVGAIGDGEYFNFLKNYAKNLGLEDRVIITEKVSDEELAGYYKIANLYLSLSDHEGFGMPLIEAMRYDVPVLAYQTGGVTSTVIWESLLKRKSAQFIAWQIVKLQDDDNFREDIIKKQKEHLKKFSYQKKEIELKNYLLDIEKQISVSVN